MGNLFGDEIIAPAPKGPGKSKGAAGDSTAQTPASLQELRNLDAKIAAAIGKVKSLKDEKAQLEARIQELEARVRTLELEIETRDKAMSDLSLEKRQIKTQIADLLSELESIETV